MVNAWQISVDMQEDAGLHAGHTKQHGRHLKRERQRIREDVKVVER
jgi:hypothetical protein